MSAHPSRLPQYSRHGRVKALASAEFREVTRGLPELEELADIEVPGEDVFPEEKLRASFAAVEVYGAHERSDEIHACSFERDPSFRFRMRVLLAQFGTLGVVGFGAVDFFAEVIIVNGAAGHASSPALFCVGSV